MIHKEEDKANLYCILDSIREIQSYVGNNDYEQFAHDEQTVEEVIKLMNNIGSAARMLSDVFKKHYTIVDWETLVNLEYMTFTQEYETNLAPVWPIIENDLPEIEDKILLVSKRIEEQE
jgi:uncharacterized protein with HEPN domain